MDAGPYHPNRLADQGITFSAGSGSHHVVSELFYCKIAAYLGARILGADRMNVRLRALSVTLVMLVSSVAVFTPVHAESGCRFSYEGTTMTLRADCTTSVTILVPDGFTLDGAGHTITAVDPRRGHFLGAVVANQGKNANVMNLRITASNLADVCDMNDKTAGTDFRLRGIQFKGASGEIAHNTVTDINQGAASSCWEGAGIEVRNEPTDGSHPNTQTVEVSDNVVMNYQMVGIVGVGDVSVKIHHNRITASAAKATVPESGIQLSYHAIGEISGNVVTGNWYQPVTRGNGKAIGQQPGVAAGILLYNIETSKVSVFDNDLRDNQVNMLVITSASLG
jgi:hypothetical protein